MDVLRARQLVDKGGLLRVSVPPATKEGRKVFASEIHVWMREVGTINGNPELMPLLPALDFLKRELGVTLDNLSNIPTEDDR